MKVAVIGTVGVPACYGGFETLVENLIGDHCSKDIEYTVFCSSLHMDSSLKHHKNARLLYIPFKANGVQSMVYDSIALLRSLRGFDIILYLGATVPLTRLFKRLCSAKIVLNMDGLSQNRDKYSPIQKKYLAFIKRNEIMMPDVVIADNQAIRDYVEQNYSRKTRMIPYGGDQAIIDMTEAQQAEILEQYGLNHQDYAISICRIEPENNCHITLEAFKKLGENKGANSTKKLIFIGNWGNSEYGRSLYKKYSDCENIILSYPVYDLNTLFALRNNASLYIHGHSVGGTNPSLVEAMFFGIPILCYDVAYNRETTYGKADYYTSSEQLINLLRHNHADGNALKKIAFEKYTWENIVNQYEQVYRECLNS